MAKLIKAKSVKGRISTKAPRGVVLWEGLSPLDGQPIICVATFKTSNRKTGNMVQTWILKADVNPVQAIKDGSDASICGGCYHRGFKNDAGKVIRKRSCYVNVGQAPNKVFDAYQRGIYPKYDANLHAKYFINRKLRWGAYGDGAMLPAELVNYFNSIVVSHTGYTHQWRLDFAKWSKGIFQASCDGLSDYLEASAHGWKTFAVVAKDNVPFSGKQCPATINESVQCITCMLCSGSKLDIFVPVHGSGAVNFQNV